MGNIAFFMLRHHGAGLMQLNLSHFVWRAGLLSKYFFFQEENMQNLLISITQLLHALLRLFKHKNCLMCLFRLCTLIKTFALGKLKEKQIKMSLYL